MIAVIGAMDVEVDALKADLSELRLEKHASMEFFVGRYAGKDLVVVKSGVGKVNAAVCTQVLADMFKVECIINTGVAGSLKPEINIGDIVVSTGAVQHDMDATGFGYQPGEIPQMGKIVFEADEGLRTLLAESCRKVNPGINVHQGLVASGDRFVAGADEKQRIGELFDAYCTEMEGCAIAQCAWLNHIPFVIIRAISDKADGSAMADNKTFEDEAALHCLRMTQSAIGNL